VRISCEHLLMNIFMWSVFKMTQKFYSTIWGDKNFILYMNWIKITQKKFHFIHFLPLLSSSMVSLSMLCFAFGLSKVFQIIYNQRMMLNVRKQETKIWKYKNYQATHCFLCQTSPAVFFFAISLDSSVCLFTFSSHKFHMKFFLRFADISLMW
jgi:hypothetical protein